MQTIFSGKKISAILGILPENECYFDDEVGNYSFPPKQTLRLKKVMGFEKHHLAKETSAVSDFAAYGFRYLLDNGWLRKEEIGAVIVVTLCPDYFVPHISTILHGEFGLSDNVLCLDLAQGCCGFLVGLMEAFLLLDHLGGKKVVLVNGDVLSHKVSKHDRNDFPLIGDAATISILENAPSAGDIYYEMHTDGSRGGALKIAAGAFRMPSTPDTAILHDQGDGNFRALDHIHMDGSEVFQFVQTEVPPMLAHAFREAGKKMEDIDYFLFHQPNKFMLKKLAEKAGIPEEKLPMNLVENFGNPSGSSIPLTAAYNLKSQLVEKRLECCLSAFGSGLAWGTIFMGIGPLDHCEIITSNL